MKKLLRILILCLSMTLLFGCVRDEIVREETDEIQDTKEDIIEKDDVIVVQNDNLENDKIIYEDDIFGFRLELPKSWENNYTIEKKPWIDDINESVEFNYKMDDISSNIFTIVIMDESIEIEDWEELFLMYIGEEGGKTFSYLNVMEPTEELLKEENKEELETVTNMVYEVPEIIESFTLIK